MTPVPAVEKSIEIAASTHDVWRALTDADKIVRWMGGTRVVSTWEPGADITLISKLNNKIYRDRGTVLAIEHGKLLKYSHWTGLSGIPDVPENRTVITFELDRRGEKTVLVVRHERFHSLDAYKHGAFFWGVALGQVQKLFEN